MRHSNPRSIAHAPTSGKTARPPRPTPCPRASPGRRARPARAPRWCHPGSGRSAARPVEDEAGEGLLHGAVVLLAGAVPLDGAAAPLDPDGVALDGEDGPRRVL